MHKADLFPLEKVGEALKVEAASHRRQISPGLLSCAFWTGTIEGMEGRRAAGKKARNSQLYIVCR